VEAACPCGEDNSIGADRPIYSQVLVVPDNARIMGGTVIGSYFVEDLVFIFKRAKAVQETGRHP
jgi:hypothetical protein